jgi:hypothetical protein
MRPLRGEPPSTGRQRFLRPQSLRAAKTVRAAVYAHGATREFVFEGDAFLISAGTHRPIAEETISCCYPETKDRFLELSSVPTPLPRGAFR